MGPKSALKLMKEHGSLGKVLEHLRAKSEEKAKAQGKKKVIEEEEVESEDEVVAPSSVIDGGSDAEEEDEEAAEERRIKAEKAAKKKAAAAKKGTGGVQVPENWLWEEAKKLFETPDVTPASEIEVRATPCLLVLAGSWEVISVALQLEWRAPDVDGLVDFLVRDKGFK